MARRSLLGFFQLTIVTELSFYWGIKSLSLLEMKMRYFRVSLDSRSEKGCFVGAGRGGAEGGVGRCELLCLWPESFCLLV